jgi:hypothetical protein
MPETPLPPAGQPAADAPTPAPSPLRLQRVNAGVFSVNGPDGAHLGNLKQIGALWKFKAVGHDAQGHVEPGGGPLTDGHNTVFAEPDAVAVNAALARLLT